MLQDLDLNYRAGLIDTTHGFTVNGVGVTPNTILPSDHGLTAWAYDPATGCNGTITAVNGTMYLSTLSFRVTTTVNKLWYMASTVGSGPVAGQNWMGLYTAAGARVASGSADSLVTLFNAAVGVTLATPYVAPAGKYWVAMLFNATAPPTMSKTNVSINAFGSGAITSAASYRFATNGTSQTTLPASITPSANVIGGSLWVAAS